MPKLYGHLPQELKFGREIFYRAEPIYGNEVYAGQPNTTKPLSSYLREIKGNGLKYRIISVLSKNLRNKTNLHGSPYKANRWVFINQKK